MFTSLFTEKFTCIHQLDNMLYDKESSLHNNTLFTTQCYKYIPINLL